jgi:hypothetical protein
MIDLSDARSRATWCVVGQPTEKSCGRWQMSWLSRFENNNRSPDWEAPFIPGGVRVLRKRDNHQPIEHHPRNSCILHISASTQFTSTTVGNYNMSFGRPMPSHLRSGSINNASSSSNQSPALLARINEKKTELANLKELQSLSAGLADQMALLEQKLSTLSDGTEGRFL